MEYETATREQLIKEIERKEAYYKALIRSIINHYSKQIVNNIKEPEQC